MAMGNWGNTPTPPNDPKAPGPVGNDGEFSLKFEKRRFHAHVQFARCAEGALYVQGESLGEGPLFELVAELPQADSTPATLREATLALAEGSYLCLEDERVPLSGSLEITSVTGSGPWEMDANVQTSEASGSLQVRVRS